MDAQSRLLARSDRFGRPPLTPAVPVSTPLTRATATPTSGASTQLLPDPLSYMYAGSSDRGHRRNRSEDRDRDSEDRPHRSSSRRSRDHDMDSRDRYQQATTSRRSRDRSDFSEDGTQRLSGSKRTRDRMNEDGGSRDRTRSSRHSSPPSHLSSSSITPAWQSRLGQGMAAFPGSRWPNTGNLEQTAMARLLRFGTTAAPRLEKGQLTSASVAAFIAYIHNLIRNNAFDESVMQMLIDRASIRLLGYYFTSSETARSYPIEDHWTTDWDAATIIQALEEYYPGQTPGLEFTMATGCHRIEEEGAHPDPGHGCVPHRDHQRMELGGRTDRPHPVHQQL